MASLVRRFSKGSSKSAKSSESAGGKSSAGGKDKDRSTSPAKRTDGSKSPSTASSNCVLDHDHEPWIDEPLTIVVCGASGDLAKKKTYPALFALFEDRSLGNKTLIVGYARSKMNDVDFRDKLKPFLQKLGSEVDVERFLSLCYFRSGQYDSAADLGKVSSEVKKLHNLGEKDKDNRVFYFALPPSTFLEMAQTVKSAGLSTKGFNRLIVEKPFGHDTESAKKLGKDLGAIFTEDYLYRIDHYLGKEMVQNVVTLRFSNAFLEPIWNRETVSSVTISFKEDIGTQGRGGYFDGYGIIRDVMQNHLMQVLSVIAMEPPVRVAGADYSNYVRDEKVKLLKCMEPWTLKNCVLGQYVAGKGEPGYLEDPTVPKGSLQPTYACCVFFIHNKRWEGVPFIMKAGKALNERRAEVRLQLKAPPGGRQMFDGQDIPRNEMVIRLQPNEAIYMKTNVKRPGLTTTITQSELDLSYGKRYEGVKIYDAYARLILDVLRGKQAFFVRDDELIAAWEVVTPLLNEIDKKKPVPKPYVFGTRGPAEADELIAKHGVVHNKQYSRDYHAASR